jgi:hypothetical protein
VSYVEFYGEEFNDGNDSDSNGSDDEDRRQAVQQVGSGHHSAMMSKLNH